MSTAPSAEIVDGCKTFIPLENNPDILEILCRNLSISPDLAFHDVLSLSPEFVREWYPRPCHALILLAHTPIYNAARSAIEPTIPEYNSSGPNEPVLWMRQTIGHACGLMALLHILFNLEGRRYVTPGSELDNLIQQAIQLGPTERAQLLYDSKFLEEAHMDAASRGSSTAPSPRDENNHHFVAFVQEDGQVWELNGGMNGPLLRGTLCQGEDLLSEKGLSLTVKDFLTAAEQGGHGEMSIVAVTGADAVAPRSS
ncbi:ubiquitin carboxyl-terminal hydrolase isozyme L3 [Penicillium cataractarum]|uniref:Ubiquitin carboxyl-terminal hydrolase n=1 Tax=Penicillium cataractarum TaxID=2100454 RepID=A0A9W9S1U3_9EURO|nr:ubiquitin carboxyl-terminal hydrolase isozyme L3 [Penicillium cataractarum]KAJ5370112.1 ubiquitin carboxyl-terminal hydrolase isozyme L3 [Penicillium cataractarum]